MGKAKMKKTTTTSTGHALNPVTIGKVKMTRPARKTGTLEQSLVEASPIVGLTVNTDEVVRLAIRTARGTVAGNVTVTVRSAVWDDSTTEQERAAVSQLARDIGTVCLAWTLKERKPL